MRTVLGRDPEIGGPGRGCRPTWRTATPRAVPWRVVAAAVGAASLLGACGTDGAASPAGARPTVVVTTSILGDVVAELVGDDAAVDVVMPAGVDPHEFSPSARQAVALREADVVVVNGLGFEAGLVDAVDAAADDGATVLAATDYVETIPFDEHESTQPGDGVRQGDHANEDDGDAGAAEDGHDGHDHEGDDPHIFTDPARMAVVASGLAADLAHAIPELATPAATARAGAVVAELEALDAEVAALLDAVPRDRRSIVTNHEVLGYFADRYGFVIVGVVSPGGTTLAAPSAGDLASLADAIERAQVPAIFVETSASRRLADALADEGTDVEVVELYTESLGPAGSEGATYAEMVRANARRIADALGAP